MTLEQIRINFGNLLNEANLKGAFNLEQANAAVQTLIALDQVIKERQHTVIKGSDLISAVKRTETPLADPHE